MGKILIDIPSLLTEVNDPYRYNIGNWVKDTLLRKLSYLYEDDMHESIDRSKLVPRICQDYGVTLELTVNGSEYTYNLMHSGAMYSGAIRIDSITIPAPPSPLTAEEQEIYHHIDQAWVKFNKLNQTHPSSIPDFADAVHILQRIIGMRVLRRNYPNIWPDRSEYCKPNNGGK